MMELTEAFQIFDALKGSQHALEFDNLIHCAIKYSRIRTDWYISAREGRTLDENRRTNAHNDFIHSCAAMSEKMKESGEKPEWRFQIGRDRKAIGDFACLLHAVLGIKAR